MGAAFREWAETRMYKGARCEGLKLIQIKLFLIEKQANLVHDIFLVNATKVLTIYLGMYSYCSTSSILK